MKNLFLLLLLFLSGWISAQLPMFDCESSYASSCNPFYLSQEAGNSTCWRPSHGAVSLTTANQQNAAVFVSSHTIWPTPTKTEGIYLDYEFEANVTYQFSVTTTFIEGAPGLNVFVANGIEESNYSGCEPSEDALTSLCTNFALVDFFYAGNGVVPDVVNFTPTSNYSQLWVTASSSNAEELYDECLLNSLFIVELGPCPPIPTTRINGSSANYQSICYGDPLLFQGSTVEGSCAYDGYMIEVGEYSNGAYTGPIASNYFDSNSIPANIDLYNYIQQYSNWWDFEGGKSYRVKLATWTNTNGYPDESTWRETAQYFNFTPATSAVDFVTADSYITKYSEQGWSAEVAQICTENIFIDASESSCHDRYKINIQKFDIYNWEAISETYTTGWIMDSEAPASFHLNSLLGELSTFYSYYETYRVFVETAFPYDSDVLFFRRLPISDAEIDGEFAKVLSEEIVYSPGIKDDYLLSTICSYQGQYTFLTEDTECEERHRIRIEEFDPQTWTSNDNFAYDSEWTQGSMPDEIAISELYTPGLQASRIYRLHLQVKEPWSEASYIFQIPLNHLSCIKEAGGDIKPHGRIAESKFDLFPNPTHSGMATLKIAQSSISQDAQVFIYKSDGSLLQHQPIGNINELEIDLSSEAPGLFFIQIHSANFSKIMKLIKQ